MTNARYLCNPRNSCPYPVLGLSFNGTWILWDCFPWQWGKWTFCLWQSTTTLSGLKFRHTPTSKTQRSFNSYEKIIYHFGLPIVLVAYNGLQFITPSSKAFATSGKSSLGTWHHDIVMRTNKTRQLTHHTQQIEKRLE